MQVVALDADSPRRLLESWHSLYAATSVELEPNVPPPPLDEALHAAALSDDWQRRACWLAVDDDVVIGYALLSLPLLDNPHLAMLEAGVAPSRRRHGIAASLIRRGLDAARDAGRRTLLVEAVDDTVGAAACKALGGHDALASTAAMLDVTSLDRSLVDRWIERRGERASGYSLVRWIGPCPDDLLAACAQLRESMNTAPLGDLDIEIEWSPDSIRAAERWHALCGRRHLVLCARDDATGDLVGITDVLVPYGRPSCAFQEDTVVRPDHRNRGLGRWLKAEMLQWLATEEPQLERIFTWNATENAAMRGINTELGFTPQEVWNEWQFDVEILRARLG